MKIPGIRIKSKNKQKQRLSQRTIVLATVFFLSAATCTMIVILNLTKPGESRAKSRPVANAILVREPELVNDKNLPAPVLSPVQASDEGTIYVRKAKQISGSRQ